ncbi:hypothetical protein K745_gp38 [Haloarcula hispanica virus PH1]|uniref:Uncharacterized protein n=1 Tax=Haloarcula hispanica virus PH1 TaxID=1282967 RepID=M4JFB2_9VIRU|nr:hypothetical protein K745_gp38 [Haloarcula hispanica virus PH1]AGC65563.1 hypothetical protein HhPH1_gp38 [Haloarcula hispanica virus PH1]
MTDERDPKVSYRMPREKLETLQTLAEQYEVSLSALLRRFDSYGLETNAEAVAVEAQIENLRQDIIDYGKPIDKAGGFAGRVRSDFEKRFKNGYDAKWLVAKAESYRREAEMLEEKVEEHPDAPPVEEGELVEEVDRVLRDALEAMKLSDWADRYSNPFERLTGVSEGKEGRRFALVLTRNALRMDRDLEPLRSGIGSERRVRADDLPDLADEELPPTVERDDVARVARQLADRGVDPDEMDLDPTEFDPFGWTDAEPVEDDVVTVESTETPELPDDAETDGDPQVVAPDGGRNEATVAYASTADDPEPDRDVGDVVEWAAERLRDERSYSDYEDWKAEQKRRKARESAENQVRAVFETDTTNWQTEIMDRSTLTPDDIVELADDYNDERTAALRGERDSAPQALEDGQGGVTLE